MIEIDQTFIRYLLFLVFLLGLGNDCLCFIFASSEYAVILANERLRFLWAGKVIFIILVDHLLNSPNIANIVIISLITTINQKSYLNYLCPPPRQFWAGLTFLKGKSFSDSYYLLIVSSKFNNANWTQMKSMNKYTVTVRRESFIKSIRNQQR
jgi:hypothetical protein